MSKISLIYILKIISNYYVAKKEKHVMLYSIQYIFCGRERVLCSQERKTCHALFKVIYILR